jgi:hypothetical protein
MPKLVAASGAETSASDTASPNGWLEISRGRTLFPRRPLLWPRFLIGAGSNCHLQLGGDGVPFLHSIIDTSTSVVRVEAFTASPELKVNGAVVRTAVLADGDQLEIGGFAFKLHGVPSLAADTADPLYAPIDIEAALAAEEDVAELSAAELVARIEEIEAEVDDFESAELTGATDLLAAVRNWKPLEQPETPELVEATPEEQLVAELATISLDVEQRLVRLRQWEAEQTARADALLSAQDRLAEQLRLAAQSLATEQARVRASA